MKVMSYNIHHGVGMDEELNIQRIGEVIQKSQANIVGLQEVDKNFGIRSDFRDQAKDLAILLDDHYCFGANLKYTSKKQNSEYGNAIFSKFPIIDYENILLTSGKEQRGVLKARINVNGTHVNVYNTHLGLDLKERMIQVKEIINIMSQDSGEKILMGDFNTESSNQDYELLMDKGEVKNTLDEMQKTFPSSHPNIRLDYIFVSKNIDVYHSALISSTASDHLPIVAELGLKK